MVKLLFRSPEDVFFLVEAYNDDNNGFDCHILSEIQAFFKYDILLLASKYGYISTEKRDKLEEYFCNNYENEIESDFIDQIYISINTKSLPYEIANSLIPLLPEINCTYISDYDVEGIDALCKKLDIIVPN